MPTNTTNTNNTDTQKFYGVKLTDTTGKEYYTEVEVKQDLTHNISVQTHKPIDSKFPYHTRIGKPSYWSGSVTAAFENNNGECEHDYTLGDTAWRIEFIEWLHNGLSKVLYLSESLILPVTILGEISTETDNTIDGPLVKVTFQWEQNGERIYSAARLKCPNCNQTIVPVTKYCPNCGNPVNGTVNG